MSSRYRKITYEDQEGIEIIERTLYAHFHNTVDVLSVYDSEKGFLFAYTDTCKRDMGSQLFKLLDNDDECQELTDEDWKEFQKLRTKSIKLINHEQNI